MRSLGCNKRCVGISGQSQADPSGIAQDHERGTVCIEEAEGRTGKRRKRRHDPVTNSTITPHPQLLVFHRVVCEWGKNHREHKSLAYYLDAPRLFEGDSKASTLRGREEITNTDEYLEDRSDISIVTYKTYSCNAYYQAAEDGFKQLQMPKDPDVANLAPYFFRLQQDGDEAKPQSERITIEPSDLMDAIIQITGMTRGQLINLEDPKNMEVLRYQAYHRRGSIAQDIRDLGSVREQHIEAFLYYIEQMLNTEFDETEALFEDGLVAKPHLSKLFGPGEVVVTFHNGQPLAYILENCTEPYKLPLALDCWSWNFDKLFWRERTILYVDWPSSAPEIAISELSTFPLKYDESGVEKRLKQRGEIFWSCRHKNHVNYSPPNPRFMQTLRYMVDMETYQQMVHGQDPTDRALERDELGKDDMGKEQPPDESFLLLLPAEIYGFGFHDRKWRPLLVEYIGKIRWNEKAFDCLVIGSSEKGLIRALVDAHTSRSRPNGENALNDFIEGKGNGLIILLHGGPGTGKTLTAESVAEVSNRPLYRITCGDIGTNAEEIERNLPDVLLFGKIWGCVLLLDEADVFLEERSEQDLQRNALVSVFLRAIEYYDGILILTSNRVGTFDEAFKSRIQLALHLPTLKKDDRRRIWNNFIDNLRETNANAKIDQLRERVKDFAKHVLNGREIRNIVKVAQQLAQSEGQPLEYRHFEQVIEVSVKFGKYLADEHGHDAPQWAKEQKIRSE